MPTMTLTPQIEAKAWHEAIALHLTCAYRLVAGFAPLLAHADAGRGFIFWRSDYAGRVRKPVPFGIRCQ